MDEPYADDADTGDVVARAEAVVARALAAHQGPFASTSTDDLIDSCERDLDALHHSGSLAYPLLASLDARLTVVLSRVHAPGAAEAVSDLADVTEYLLHTLGERRDEMCLLESDHQFQLKIAAGLLALDELPVANRPALHVPSFAAEDPDRFREFRDRLLADIEPSTEPERTWSTRTRNVLAQTGDRHRAALCLDWLTVAIDTSDWAATLAASVIGRYGTIVSMAAKVGCPAETLRRWVRQYQTDHGQRAGVSTEDHAPLRELEREV